jgi:hypothetical protein
MLSRRFSLTPITLGLLSAFAVGTSLFGSLPVSAQPATASTTAKPAPSSKAPAQDDGPVAVTARTNNPSAPIPETKPLQKNQFSNFGNPLLNNRGELVFMGRYHTDKGDGNYGSALFTIKPDGSWAYIRDGVKGLNFSSAISSIHQVGVSDSGDMIFNATLDEMAKPFKVSGSEVANGNVRQAGLFIKNAEGLKSLYMMGQEIPNNPATYIGFSNASINSKGTVSFIGTYTDPDGRGLFILENGKLTIVARSGQKTPAGGETQYSEHFYPSAINDRGEVAFFCRISGGGGIFVRRPTFSHSRFEFHWLR